MVVRRKKRAPKPEHKIKYQDEITAPDPRRQHHATIKQNPGRPSQNVNVFAAMLGNRRAAKG